MKKLLSVLLILILCLCCVACGSSPNGKLPSNNSSSSGNSSSNSSSSSSNSSSNKEYSTCQICGGKMKCKVCGKSGMYCENSTTGYGTNHYCNDHCYIIWE